MPEIYGIDVSEYQGKINWREVKAAGKEFVFVRLGWAERDGTVSMDSMAEENIEGAVAAGLHVGVYVYSDCKTAESARLAAQATVALAKGFSGLDYPVAFDMEDTGDTGAPCNEYGKSINSAIAAAYLDEIEAAGYYAMLYTDKNFADNYLNMAALKKYDVWIAHYAGKNGYTGAYGIWQYAGDSGRCGGVDGACDLNVSYRDYAAVIRAAGRNGIAKVRGGRAAAEIADMQKEIETLRARISQLEAKLRELAS